MARVAAYNKRVLDIHFEELATPTRRFTLPEFTIGLPEDPREAFSHEFEIGPL